jgi:hypothetical protein
MLTHALEGRVPALCDPPLERQQLAQESLSFP